jgi:predicted amidophosphoribosyltransferase
MLCPKCGRSVDERSPHCPNCGAELNTDQFEEFAGRESTRFQALREVKSRIGVFLLLVGTLGRWIHLD